MEKGRSRVSIGMPVYNGEKYLRSALDSLLKQDYANFELIISDNASTDGTAQICQEFVAKDRRVAYFRNDSKVEVFANFGLALQRARGEYFMWAAADDSWLPNFVSALAAELDTDPEAAVAMCATKRIREDGTLVDYVRLADVFHSGGKRHFALAMALASGKPYHLCFYGLFRTEFIKRAFARIPMVVLGDRLFVCELALATSFRYVDQVLYIRMGHDQPIPDRYVGEELGRIWTERLKYAKLVAAVVPYLAGSPMIPWRRKIFIPAVALRFAWMQRKRVRREIWGRLRSLVGQVARRNMGRLPDGDTRR